jgi:sugar/nucleoside kinase (ribokinase family)
MQQVLKLPLYRFPRCRGKIAVSINATGERHNGSITENAHQYTGRGPTVQAVDVVGAGDSFSATIVAAVLVDLPLSRALPVACDHGTFVVTQKDEQAILAYEHKHAVD